MADLVRGSILGPGGSFLTFWGGYPPPEGGPLEGGGPPPGGAPFGGHFDLEGGVPPQKGGPEWD